MNNQRSCDSDALVVQLQYAKQSLFVAKIEFAQDH